MSLPKVGVQVVVQDMQKFTRDISGVESQIKKISKSFESLSYQASGAGASKLANMFMGIGLAAEAAAGPIGLVIAAVQALMVIEEKITGPFKRAKEAILDFAKDLAGKAWEGIKSFAKGVFDFFNIIPELFDLIKRSASIAFGVLVRDSIRAVGEAIRNLASGALEAASNFQTLEIRLKGIIAKDLMEVPDIIEKIFVPPTTEQRLALINYTDSLGVLKTRLEETRKAYDDSVQSTGQYSKQSLELEIEMSSLTNQIGATQKEINALTLSADGLLAVTKVLPGKTKAFADVEEEAAKQAKELLKWISRLAIETPFSTQDVANVYTLARSYGIAGQQAQDLTQAVGNFTAGMGLTGLEMERIIVNLGQMTQQGKVTGRELTDLARGALVPTSRIFELIGKEIGKTTAEVRAMASTGELSVDQFINAFIKMSNQDFPGAAKNMTRTLAGLKERIKDFSETALGMFVLKPALDKFSGFFSDMLGGMLDDPRLYTALETLGLTLGKSMDLLLNALFPSGIEDKGSKLITFIETLRDLIYTFNSGDWDLIQEQLMKLGIPEWVLNTATNLYNAWVGVKTFFDENKEFLVTSIETILNAMGLNIDLTGGIEGFTQSLENIGSYMSANGDTIRGKISDIVTAISDFFTLIRGGTPTEMTTEGGMMVETPKETTGFLKTVKDIYDTFQKFGDEAEGPATRFFDAIARIVTILGGDMSSAEGGVSLLERILNASVSVTETTATILERIADALDRIINPPAPKGGYSGKVIPSIIEGWETAQSKQDEYLNPDSGILSKQVQDYTDGVEKKFKGLSGRLIGHSVIPEMLSDIETAFTNAFSLGGTIFTAITTFVTNVISKFTEMWNEMTKNSIIPDMMDDIEDSMVGGFKDTFKQSEKLADKFTGAMQASATMASGVPFAAGGTYNNNSSYQYTFNANYAQTQSPVTLKYDIEALLAATKV